MPRFNALDDADEIRRLVTSVGSAQLVTVGADGYPAATLLPVLWDDDRIVLHIARANVHWRAIEPGAPALAVVTGPEAYVSPGWYASKAEHGRVVPTWNYSAVQFTGRVDVHTDHAAYETQFGHVVRPTHENTTWDAARFEVCAHRWVRVADGGYGVGLANDSTYGHDVTRHQRDGGGTYSRVRLSLLRAPLFPDP